MRIIIRKLLSVLLSAILVGPVSAAHIRPPHRPSPSPFSNQSLAISSYTSDKPGWPGGGVRSSIIEGYRNLSGIRSAQRSLLRSGLVVILLGILIAWVHPSVTQLLIGLAFLLPMTTRLSESRLQTLSTSNLPLRVAQQYTWLNNNRLDVETYTPFNKDFERLVANSLHDFAKMTKQFGGGVAGFEAALNHLYLLPKASAWLFHSVDGFHIDHAYFRDTFLLHHRQVSVGLFTGKGPTGIMLSSRLLSFGFTSLFEDEIDESSLEFNVRNIFYGLLCRLVDSDLFGAVPIVSRVREGSPLAAEMASAPNANWAERVHFVATLARQAIWARHSNDQLYVLISLSALEANADSDIGWASHFLLNHLSFQLPWTIDFSSYEELENVFGDIDDPALTLKIRDSFADVFRKNVNVPMDGWDDGGQYFPKSDPDVISASEHPQMFHAWRGVFLTAMYYARSDPKMASKFRSAA